MEADLLSHNRIRAVLWKLHLSAGGLVDHFSKIDVTPGTHLRRQLECLLILRPSLRNSINPGRVAWAANRPQTPSFGPQTVDGLPAVELVFPATSKDFQILPFAIGAAIAATENPVSAITVYVPQSQLNDCSVVIQEHFSLYQDGRIIDIRSDESVLTVKTLEVLKNRFGNRAGWYIQQMIKLSSVYNSSASGVLVVDSDTVLLRPRVWIVDDGRQILTPTYELHQPYRDHLNALSAVFKGLDKSFVSHHMLMQPKLLKSIFTHIGIDSIDDLAIHISNFGKEEDLADFFCEYELYSHGLISFHLSSFEYVKWANVPMRRPISRSEIGDAIEQLKNAGEYFSVSMHDYL